MIGIFEWWAFVIFCNTNVLLLKLEYKRKCNNNNNNNRITSDSPLKDKVQNFFPEVFSIP